MSYSRQNEPFSSYQLGASGRLHDFTSIFRFRCLWVRTVKNLIGSDPSGVTIVPCLLLDRCFTKSKDSYSANRPGHEAFYILYSSERTCIDPRTVAMF